MQKKKYTNCERALFYSYHIILVVLCIAVCTLFPRKISTSFIDAVPSGNIPEGYLKAQGKLMSSQNKSITVFIKCRSFETAKTAAEEACSMLSDTGLFKDISCESNFTFDESEIEAFINKNAVYLLDDKTIESIKDNPGEFAQDSLARIYGGFSLCSLDNLVNDPFFLSDSVIMSYIDKASALSPFSPEDGILAAHKDDNWYVIINGTLTDKALSVLNKNTAKDIFSVADFIEQKYPLCNVYTSGFPLHANESAVKSRNEITFITAFSLLAMSVLFILVFRNFAIVRLFLLSISLSVLSAVSAVLIAFPGIHVMTFIFGTTLIGTCIDYSIHFYVRYSMKSSDEDAYDTRKKLSKSLTVGFVSTAVCYAALILSGYKILKQIAVFSCAGLLSSYMTAMILYPALINDRMINRNSFLRKSRVKINIPYLLPYMAIGATVIFTLQFNNIRINNNITTLYKPEKRLMESEACAAGIYGYTSSIYAIASGETEMIALENAGNFAQKARNLGYTVLSSDIFIPSETSQKRSLEAVRLLKPFIESQYNAIGISEDEVCTFSSKLDNPGAYVSKSSVPDNLRNALDAISIGEIDGIWYEAIIIRDCDNINELKDIAKDNVIIFNTSEDISLQLDKLTKLIIILFAVSATVMLTAVIIIYGLKRGIRIAMSPYTIVLFTISLAPITGMEIDFFYAVGMVLVIGLGLDYIVFASDEEGGGNTIAVALSFLTTELSFGTLLLSSFRPVHIFGLVVFTGILAAFLCAIFSNGDKYI